MDALQVRDRISEGRWTQRLANVRYWVEADDDAEGGLDDRLTKCASIRMLPA